MFLRKLGKRGVAMTEYAVLLAFVAAIGGSFASDNGLSGSINTAIGKAKDAINLVMGGESNSVNSKYTFLEGTDPYKAAVSNVVDSLYEKFNKEGKLLASISWDDNGNINRVSYYNDTDPSNKNYSKIEGSGNVSAEYGTSRVSDVISSSTAPVNNGHIAFDKEGNVIKWLPNQTDRLDYTHMDFVSVNDSSKYYQIEAGKTAPQNTFSHVTVDDLNKNAKYQDKTSNYE